MFAKIAYKQNINMWKTKFSLQGTKLFFRPETISANNVLSIFSIILEFRNLKFPELGNFASSHTRLASPEVVDRALGLRPREQRAWLPGRWNLGTSELVLG